MPSKRKILAIGTAFFNTGSDTTVVYDAIAVQKGELLTAYIRWETGDVTVTFTDSAGGRWTVYKSFFTSCGTAIAVSWNHPGGSAVVVTGTFSSSQGYRAGIVVRLTGGDVRDPVLTRTVLYGADGVAPRLFVHTPPGAITFLAQASFSSSSPEGILPAKTIVSQVYSGFSYNAQSPSGGRFHGHTAAAGLTAAIAISILDPDQTPLLKSLPLKILFPAGSGGTTYIFAVSGGVSFSGAAPQLRTRVSVPSGGISFAGTAPNIRDRIQIPSGGVTFSGTAAITNDNVYTITPSGGVNFSGTIPQVHERISVPTGGVSFGGSARLIFVPVGGVSQQPTRITVGVSKIIGVS